MNSFESLQKEATEIDKLLALIQSKTATCQSQLAKLKSTKLSSLDWQKYHEIASQFPRKPHFMLTLALGSASFALGPKRISYKKEYEEFKLQMTRVLGILSLLALWNVHPLTDYTLQFTLLYYYCTLVLREHILMVNGSTMKSYWLVHHYLSILLSGLFLMWPFTPRYLAFRPYLLWFLCYMSVLQVLQYHYQQSRLYALVALDYAKPMDTAPSDGFLSSNSQRSRTKSEDIPKHGLNVYYLLPWLLLCQAWQAGLSGFLLNLYGVDVPFLSTRTFDHPPEWHVLAAGILCGMLAIGNALTTISTILNDSTHPFSKKFD